jgi:hypothetical protein
MKQVADLLNEKRDELEEHLNKGMEKLHNTKTEVTQMQLVLS